MFLYTVTYWKNLPLIAKYGLLPGSKAAMGAGGYAGHSRGRLFFTGPGGVDFWYDRAKSHAEDASDDPREDGLAPVVLRVPLSAFSSPLSTDDAGTRDASHQAWYTTTPIDPSGVSVWTGAEWVPIEGWKRVMPDSAFELWGDYWSFNHDDPLRPRFE